VARKLVPDDRDTPPAQRICTVRENRKPLVGDHEDGLAVADELTGERLARVVQGRVGRVDAAGRDAWAARPRERTFATLARIIRSAGG
jgi:hypothetical protein